jgi:hypothetical protein
MEVHGSSKVKKPSKRKHRDHEEGDVSSKKAKRDAAVEEPIVKGGDRDKR